MHTSLVQPQTARQPPRQHDDSDDSDKPATEPRMQIMMQMIQIMEPQNARSYDH
ncbi:hypothetical protein PAXINDRAFT_11916 [Paxillus involutus ATCC 200175]|uniref:Uncharacterized protein n=1 Tax=Paxillus involutus ATCC 200175 TaxID=664439 RepID=A0A0C9TYI0_PAXIN|nr:hypothetical protein PAXINDRAFT_11916 [Paxillus involutus ATCC 200175]